MLCSFPQLFFLFHAGSRGLGSYNSRNSSYKEKTVGSAGVSRLSFRFLDYVLSNKMMFVCAYYVRMSLSLLTLFLLLYMKNTYSLCNSFSNILSKRDAHSIILRIKNQVGLVIYSYLYIFKFVKLLYKFILNAFYARRYKVSDIFLSCHNLRQNLQALMILSVLCTSYFHYQFFSQKYSESVIQK